MGPACSLLVPHWLWPPLALNLLPTAAPTQHLHRPCPHQVPGRCIKLFAHRSTSAQGLDELQLPSWLPCNTSHPNHRQSLCFMDPAHTDTAVQAVKRSLGPPAASGPSGKLLWELCRRPANL